MLLQRTGLKTNRASLHYRGVAVLHGFAVLLIMLLHRIGLPNEQDQFEKFAEVLSSPATLKAASRLLAYLSSRHPVKGAPGDAAGTSTVDRSVPA